jgi:PAS domain S-box-containing protein
VPSPSRDRVLRVLIALWLAETVAAMALSLAGLGAGTGPSRPFDDVHGWLALTWFVLLVGVLWRLALEARRLRCLLASRDQHLAAMAVTSHDWLWAASADLVATSCSPAITQLLGRRPEDVVGCRFVDLVAAEDRPRLEEVIAGAVANRQGWDDVELRWVHADGHLVVLETSAVPDFDGRANLVGFRGTHRLAPLDAAARRRSALSCEIRDVLDNRTLAVALQPIIDTDTGAWVAAEALARFPGDRRPDVCFAEAQEAGLGVEWELLAVENALAALPELPDDVALSINASPALIVDRRLAAVLSRPGIPLDRLVVEITEHVAVAHYDEIRAALRPLREHGLRLAIDDTGAGYASFSHVLALRPDIIKLDRSLIADIDTDPARRAFVTAIVLLALELRASITAEGVESMGELAVLTNLGADHAQGFLLARPTVDREQWRSWRETRWPKTGVDDASWATAS